MKGFKLKNANLISLEELEEPKFLSGSPKIKMTMALITLADLLRYNGEIDCDNIVLGENGIGVVSEAEPNLFEIEKGKHAYVESNRECGECHCCISGDYNKCSNMMIAGVDYDGFLRDFMSAPAEKIFALPENVSDFEALFINQISRSIEVVDKLHIKRGDYVVVIGSTNFGIILSQLLIYYSAVPILITNDKEGERIAKDSGIYYILSAEENWQKEVSLITSGRLAEKVVYINECGIPTSKALALASFGADVAFTGVSVKTNSLSLNLAIKKQLNIKCINSGFNNTASSINLLSNKAINLSKLKINKVNFNDLQEVFTNLASDFAKGKPVTETVVEMI